MLRRLDMHPMVRAAIELLDPEGHLDVALLRLGGRKLGRPLSQAVGTAVRGGCPGALGVGYHSRLASDERCFAIWGTTLVDVKSAALDPDNPRHRDAVRAVAARFEIDLPEGW